jgi:hypothetical protein
LFVPSASTANWAARPGIEALHLTLGKSWFCWQRNAPLLGHRTSDERVYTNETRERMMAWEMAWPMPEPM